MCLENLPRLPRLEDKLQFFDKVLHAYWLDPKQFLQAYLTHDDPKIKSNRRLWGAPIGWPTTTAILIAIKQLVRHTAEGRACWNQYILSEARTSNPHRYEGGARGQFPGGNYHNARKITPDFFLDESKATQTEKLVTADMPFLYKLILHKVQRDQLELSPALKTRGPTRSNSRENQTNQSDSESDKELESDIDTAPAETQRETPLAKKTALEEIEDCEEPFDRANRPHVIASTVCLMVSFAANRRDNALQIQNSVVLLACGVTERVSAYLNYIGLASSRRTAHRAISSLGRLAERKVARQMASQKSPMAPIICLDNLDFKESVHEKLIEKTTQMFHGTWGYLHVPDKQLINEFDPDNFSLKRYQTAIEDSADMKVQPAWFLPDNDASLHFREVLKSQITKVLLGCIATPSDKKQKLRTVPPPIDPIAVKKPDISLFKLMIALDNSTEGVGEVLEGFLRQMNLTSEEFYS
ncbi:hypothetical protein PTTG_29855 [Puccinia triticina 1-1 BBBD Race 1]|uniref:DUF6589 domain-containing protein n=1 Tax=Puccinia triticina (isolate 1-1 / race 1 (BBBD)) TaxID=630390 RepID=A0A180G1S8_PUCT1|nr:hypothetical protein PTTG_29855 [Puccinia triticina 1-1 BBBD Race 1]